MNCPYNINRLVALPHKRLSSGTTRMPWQNLIAVLVFAILRQVFAWFCPNWPANALFPPGELSHFWLRDIWFHIHAKRFGAWWI